MVCEFLDWPKLFLTFTNIAYLLLRCLTENCHSHRSLTIRLLIYQQQIDLLSYKKAMIVEEGGTFKKPVAVIIRKVTNNFVGIWLKQL